MPDSKMRILVVDDFSTMRRIIKAILKQLGYDDIEEAEDGKQAYEKLKAGKFDFVVSDWNMPNMTGIELLRAVRSDPALKDMPFLMVTAETEKHIVVEAIQAGVSNYIVKPFTAKLFEEKMDKILEKLGN